MVTRSVVATNWATSSDNRIHDDATARRFGFDGGLVPGVTLFAYLINPIVREWGKEWLAAGWVDVRFVVPVYDGDTVSATVTGADVELRNSAGTVCAVGTAGVSAEALEPPVIPDRPLPDPRPPVSEEALAPGTVLGSVRRGFHAEHASEYLAQIGEDLPIFTDGTCAHPGWLLLDANNVLAANVALGPWIHTASRVGQLRPVTDGDVLTTRAVVAECDERKGHRFVELDVVTATGDTAVSVVRHTAIWRIRERA